MGHKRLLLVFCSVSVVVIQLYSVFGLACTGGEGDPLWEGVDGSG